MRNTLEHFLNAADGVGAVMAHARLLLKLARRFERIAPPGLVNAAGVANYKSGKVVILAENGAVAAKLRQMSQRLCTELSKGGPECSALEVKVQPRQFPYRSMASTPKPLSGQAVYSLSETAKGLPEGPLRAALQQLLERSLKQE